MRIIFLKLILLLFVIDVFAQTLPTSQHGQIALPFLLITPDARAAGMGDVGVSTASDVYSMYWNAAKYAFAEKAFGIGISITPWKRQLADDMNVFYLSGFQKLDNLQSLAASIKYFTLGKNVFSDHQGNEMMSYKPMDLSLDVAYLRKLSEVFSLSTTIKYVRSDIVALDFIQGQGLTGNSFAADIGAFFQKPLYIGDKTSTIAFGANLANIGQNIKYGSTNQPMPILAKVGGSYTAPLDNSITYTLSAEVNKLLVKNSGDQPNISTGLEVVLIEKFALRTGYYQSETIPEKGKYFTTGLGLNHLNFSFNFSYLFPTQDISALNNTIRYSFAYNIGGEK